MRMGPRLALAGAAMLALAGCTAQPTPSPSTAGPIPASASASASAPAARGPASPTISATTSVSATPVAAASPSAGGSGHDLGWRGSSRTAGCAPNGGRLPADTRTRTIADVDGDGKRDTSVLDEAGGRVGVLTHSGHLSLTRGLWGSGPAQQRLYSAYLSDGITALLSSDQRSVSLGYYVDCGIIIPKDHSTPPQPFRFALYGHDGVGTGVRCRALADSGGQHQLLGVDAVQDGDSFLINTTVISTSNRGVTADSGLMASDGEHGKDSAAAERAKTVDCGGFVHSSGK